ncbi:MAG: hypothetical protein KME60_24960 [Cyanomargarita calcarea GSE-NOS-MK-12-04C]|jgi:hypothetical protein|uniref:DUF4114 domain-containing protein n=1 Tax=Cyanomargarita calcarea GSE-NOS-MK-12-04C TaxID=2839659 RepID=A0A951QRD8_9CYAN|nr:hypothetical protein [Cyanomargarita calcarea GSE-NOS-MK-12-04C]
MTKKSKSIFSPLWWGLGLALACVSPAFASESFDNQAIQFDKDTSVEFEFVESRGAYQSTFGIVNLSTGEKTPLLREVKPSDDNQQISSRNKDFLGTPGNTVPNPFAEFNFKANTPYSLYLESTIKGKDGGIVYTSSRANKAGNQQAKLSENFSGLEDGRGVKISWDDTGSVLVKPSKDDSDFNDFVVIAGGFKPCRYGDSGLIPVQPAPIPVEVEVPIVKPKPPVRQIIPQTW